MGSKACSASIKAAVPPSFWHWAITSSVKVVLPEDSGPYISTILPLGSPPMPKAISKPSEPVGIAGIFSCLFSPIRMTVPEPNCLSI